jgi:hypothetical protein
VGRRKFATKAEFIPEEQAVTILKAYAHNHPIAFGELSQLFLGERLELDSDAPQQIAKKMPMVAFHAEQAI